MSYFLYLFKSFFFLVKENLLMEKDIILAKANAYSETKRND